MITKICIVLTDPVSASELPTYYLADYWRDAPDGTPIFKTRDPVMPACAAVSGDTAERVAGYVRCYASGGLADPQFRDAAEGPHDLTDENEDEHPGNRIVSVPVYYLRPRSAAGAQS